MTPVIIAMYGYNAAIRIKSIYPGGGSTDTHRRSYYGVSVGVGKDIKYNTKGNNVSLAILLPFRNAAFRKDYDEYEDNLKH